MYDLIIRGGRVVDGTAAPGVVADVAVQQGRIAEIGRIREQAHRTIDADGAVVAPGFIDVHTHYDAQVFWDPILSPSSLHGVTTAIAGNCGFTIAPIDDSSADYVRRMLARVEGMPLGALEAGLDWQWKSTADFFDLIDGAVGINIGFLVGHSTVRRLVMGEESTKRHATPDELEAMKGLVRAGIQAGALGFSSSLGLAHQDWEGSPVPSRHAEVEEIVALAAVCHEYEGTSLEFIPGDILDLTDEQIALMARMSAAARRPLNWNVLRLRKAELKDRAFRDLRAGTAAEQQGAKVVALTMPIPSRARFSFDTGMALDALPGWAPIMALPHDVKLRVLRDPAERSRLDEAAKTAAAGFRDIADWETKVIAEGFSPAAKGFEGRRVGEIAKEQGKSPFDALLDIVCDDDLRTTFSHGFDDLSSADWEANVEIWREGHAVIGASDAGAHLDFTSTYDYPIYVLENAVRGHGVISLEEAVHLMTDVPARLYGLRDRGRLEVGALADVIVFDESISAGSVTTRFDLPSGAGRLYSEPTGMHNVIVNGTPAIDNGEVVEKHAGKLLRSGKDTANPEMTV